MTTILRLTAAAIALAGVTLAAAVEASARPGKQPFTGEMFDAADADGDGAMTRAEFDAQRAARFADIDADGDGALSQDELAAHREAKWAERRARMFNELDADDDGAISKAEFAAPPVDMFARLDQDGDGVVTKEEAENARPHRRRHEGK